MRILPSMLTLSLLFLCVACPSSEQGTQPPPSSQNPPQAQQPRETPPPFSSLPLKEQLAGCWEQAPDTVTAGTPIQRFQFNPRGEDFTLQRAGVNKFRAGEIVQDVQEAETVSINGSQLQFKDAGVQAPFQIDTEDITMDLTIGSDSFKLLKLPMICSFENASVKAADANAQALFERAQLQLSGDLKTGLQAQITGADGVYLSVLNRKNGEVLYTRGATFVFEEVAEKISEVVVQGKKHLRLYPSTSTPSGGDVIQPCSNGVIIYSDPQSDDFIKIAYLDKNTFENPAGLKASDEGEQFLSRTEASGKVIFESSLGDKDCAQ